MAEQNLLSDLLGVLPALHAQHAPGTSVYSFLKRVAREEVEAAFSSAEARPVSLSPIGEVSLPYFKMGAVDSLNLFDLDELILFSFYAKNKSAYKRALDIGANIGLHSIIMNRCGFEVRCFEPDPIHFAQLTKNLELNHCKGVTPINAAVSDRAGSAEFVRVKGNTTGSHIAGSKPNPYGELDRFPVKIEDVQAHFQWADLIKLDAEGHEKQILLAIKAEDWRKTDAMVEVSGESNAQEIYKHFAGSGISLFAQKLGWRRIADIKEMPINHHDGSLFISAKSQVPWQ